MSEKVRDAFTTMLIMRWTLAWAICAVMAEPCAAQIDNHAYLPATAVVGTTFQISPIGQALSGTVQGDLYDEKGNHIALSPGSLIDNEKGVSFQLPQEMPGSRYVLRVTVGTALTNQLVPGEMRIVRTVSIDSASPTTAYRDSNGRFNFDLIGDNFSRTARDNQVEVQGHGEIINSWEEPTRRCDAIGTPLPCLAVDPDGHRLHVFGYAAPAGAYQGPLSVRVRVGALGVASDYKSLVLARMSAPAILVITVGLFGILGYIIYRLVSLGIREQVIGRTRYSALYAFFMDPQTNTYSLSKFQLLAFSMTFVFSYLYVLLCGWFVQWHFVLPDIPSNLAALLGVSGGTTLAAAGATQTRGTKGAGGVRPSVADFVTNGGLVAPERFQFFNWTLVACGGFLALLISEDPAKITDFPTIPDGLLYVMGVSSATYVGGKLTRKPGPVVKAIQIDPGSQGNPVLIVQGENLSTDADFSIDGRKLPIVPDAQKPKDTGGQPVPLIQSTPQDDGSGDRSFSSELKITILPAARVNLAAGDHAFKIVNPDGQYAELPFTSDPPVISSISPASPATSTAKTQVTISGSGFRADMIARWTAAAQTQPVDIPPSDVTFVDATTLRVSLVPGPPGVGTLFLQTPGGDSTTYQVTISTAAAAA